MVEEEEEHRKEEKEEEDFKSQGECRKREEKY